MRVVENGWVLELHRWDSAMGKVGWTAALPHCSCDGMWCRHNTDGVDLEEAMRIAKVTRDTRSDQQDRTYRIRNKYTEDVILADIL